MFKAFNVRIFAVGLLLITAVVFGQAPAQPTVWATKPDVAGFEKIIGDRLAAAQTSIDQVTAVKGARTIENTLAPFDEAVRQINSSLYLAGLIQQVHPDAKFRDSATNMVSKASAAQTALALNRDVYQALSGLDVSKQDAATQYYVKRTLLEFRLAGVDKDDATRTQLKKLNDDLTNEQSEFDRNISDDQKKVEVADAKELDGLPQDYIDRHKPGADGKIIITTNYPDALPVLKFSKSDDLRKRLFEAFDTRAYPKNKEVLENMMKTRYQMATILGYASWADYNAADKMIEHGGNIADFIEKVNQAARPVMEREFAMLLAEKKKTDPSATEVGDYENGYLSEQLRRSQYNFDSQAVRPYLPFNEVRQGILDTASTLFHVKFVREENVPSWDPTVETWDVLDGGKTVGTFLSGHAPAGGEIQPRGNGAGARRDCGQATAGSDSGVQLSGNHERRSGIDGVWRRGDVLPRVRPSDAPHSRRTAEVGRDQRH